MTCFLLVGACCVRAELDAAPKNSEVTKLEVVDLGEAETDSDAEDSEVQRKRDSGYSYDRPANRFALLGHGAATTRIRVQVGQLGGYKGRIVNKHPAQIHAASRPPPTKYGPPSHQNSPSARPSPHGQQHQLQQHHHHHHLHHHQQQHQTVQFNQQHSGNFNGRPSGPVHQEVPSPIRDFDFVETSPITGQNTRPFGPSSGSEHSQPSNQELPVYSAPSAFAPQRPSLQIQQQRPQQSQNLVQSQENQISDAALFLSQNAAAIQQLYGSPPTEQDFAPSLQTSADFAGLDNQVQTSGQLQVAGAGDFRPAPALPSYASGTLNAQETLQHIQSLEKDRLIVQLQRALAVQSQQQPQQQQQQQPHQQQPQQSAADAAGRYAQNQPSFVDNQELLASLGHRTKIHGLSGHEASFGVAAGTTAFNQSPFLPGTTISPGGQFPLSYGFSTTTQTPATAVKPTTADTATSTAFHGADGTAQVASSLPAAQPSQPGRAFPVYGGFVPTIIAGPAFVAGLPAYGTAGTGLLTPTHPVTTTTTTTTAVQSTGSGTSPTHFGIPIPTDPVDKPSASPVPATPGKPALATPQLPPLSGALPLPVHPVTALHPVSTATFGRPVVGSVTPLHPVVPAQTPLHPVLPAQTPLHPVVPAQTPLHHPVAVPAQSPSVVTSQQTPGVLLKPVKPVYPFYYYPNQVAYHLQKPAALPGSPWSYAPAYAKPLQIWK